MSEIIIKKVENSKEMREFILFNWELYKDCPNAVPDLLEDTLDTFNKKKNAAFEFCQAEWFMAYRDGKLVGKCVGIINKKANERWQTNTVRFGWIDFIDDKEVSKALIDAVAQWGKEHGMDTMEGPLGFTDMDPEGMLFEGFDVMGSMPTIYNYPYYNDHLEALGFKSDAIWEHRHIYLSEKIGNRDSKFFRVAELVKKRYGFKTRKFHSKSELRKSGYVQKVFEIINASYKDLHGYSELSKRQIEDYARMYVPLLDLGLLSIVENKDGEPIAVGVGISSLSEAIRKAKARLFPFGWYHILKALFWKRSKCVDLLLIGALPKYHDTGCISLIFADMIPHILKMGYEVAETGPQLNDNIAGTAFWKALDTKIVKRRRTWKKNI